MDIRLSVEERALKDRARRFTEEHLIPLELECEEHDGLTPESHAAAKAAVLEWQFHAINHRPEDGGQGLDLFQQVLVEEEWGRATGALWDIPWRPAIPLAAATEAQKDEYLRPACRGERRDAYAITEEGAGSDPSMVTTAAVRDGEGWRITGEKWHVTSGDVADFFLVHAHVNGDRTKPTIFLVDKDLPGVRLVRTPKYMHTFVFEHPTGLTADAASDCLRCHENHGSSNPKQLVRARVEQLCLECHSQIGGNTLGSQPPSIHNISLPRWRNCTSCHVAIHGSNLSPTLFK